MMEKISQRTPVDCSICVVAMVMGPPYTYEKVSQDSKKYLSLANWYGVKVQRNVTGGVGMPERLSLSAA